MKYVCEQRYYHNGEFRADVLAAHDDDKGRVEANVVDTKGSHDLIVNVFSSKQLADYFCKIAYHVYDHLWK